MKSYVSIKIKMRKVHDIYRLEKLKWSLLDRYKGEDVEDVLEGRERETPEGPVYQLENRYEFPVNLPDDSDAADAILSDLRLVRGVGEKREMTLKESGYQDLVSLREDDKFRGQVEPIIKEVRSQDVISLQRRLEKWHNMSHPNCYKLLGFVAPEDMIFFDIETMGLRYRPVFLVGVGKVEDDVLNIRQYLARNLREERGVIGGFMNEVGESNMLVSFNGRSFDSRFLLERMGLLGIEGNMDLPHFDLLHFSRGIWDEKIPDNRLATLEKHILGKEREVELASAMVPNFYKMYLKKNNPGPLLPIIEHNRDDIVSLVLLLDEMYNFYRESE